MATPMIKAAMRPFKALFVSDAFEGMLLIAVAAAAMIVANSPLAELYEHILHGTLPWTPIAKLDTFHLWINDAMMAVFFFVVGLEVKRELIAGNLADPKQRTLPVLAAAAGMAVPVAVFLVLTRGDPQLRAGMAIPAATDIAFAMGVVGLLGSRVPASLRLFLLTVAIVDDIGAVGIIAIFYSTPYMPWLLASLVVLAVMIAMNRMKVDRIWPYMIVAVILWYCVLNSGVHATIAGVLAALTIPMHRRDGNSMLERVEHALVGWNAYLVVPLFGFANAGVDMTGLGFGALFDPLPLAVGAGLVVGKQLGIFSCIFAADKLGIAARPPGATWPEIWGTTILCGIGFTMSLFIGELAFPLHRELIDEAKIGILSGSLISAVLGYIVLRLTTRHPELESGHQEPVAKGG